MKLKANLKAPNFKLPSTDKSTFKLKSNLYTLKNLEWLSE